MIDLHIEQEISEVFPGIKVGALIGEVENSEHQVSLWNAIDLESERIREKHDFDSIREIAPIKAGKQAYRDLGKDPNRYRVSAEAMCRRLVKGSSLYHIHTLVDVLNFASIKSGVTIGGFDMNFIKDPIQLGIGLEDEEFEAIGRGDLNIHRLPVYRDTEGAIGSPTSDCTRTMLRPETSKFLMIITDFYNDGFIEPVIKDLKESLLEYASGKNFESTIFN